MFPRRISRGNPWTMVEEILVWRGCRSGEVHRLWGMRCWGSGIQMSREEHGVMPMQSVKRVEGLGEMIRCEDS